MNPHTVDGYYFEDLLLAERAGKEAENVEYIRSRANLNDPKAIYSIYCKLVNQNVFTTPIGQNFLSQLYTIIIDSGEYEEASLPKILVQASTQSEKDSGSDQANKALEADTDETIILEAVRKRTEQITSTSKKKVSNIRDLYRDKLRCYKLTIGVLMAVILGLLGLMYFSDASPFLDQEKKVLDQYASWQEELSQKEKELNEREKALFLLDTQKDTKESDSLELSNE